MGLNVQHQTWLTATRYYNECEAWGHLDSIQAMMARRSHLFPVPQVPYLESEDNDIPF